MATTTERMPYGVGRMSGGWSLLTGLLVLLTGVGVYAYGQQLVLGEYVTGLRNIGTMGGATWGLYIAFAIYFIGVSFAGITVAVLIRLANLEHLRPVGRLAEVMTIVALLLGGLSILADSGQPARAVVNLLQFARPQSPFFGTFTLVVSGYLFASVVYLYLGGRSDAARLAERPSALQGFYRRWAAGYRDTPVERERHRRTSFWLALAILPLLVTAHSTLGFVFGLLYGRPGWFSGLQAPGFVALAGVSGVGLLIVLSALLRRVLKLEGQIGDRVFHWLANFLMVLTALYLYFTIVEWLTAAYATAANEAAVTSALLVGSYAPIFWTSIGLLALSFLLLFYEFTTRRYSISLIVATGVMVNIAAIGKRYLIVVPSQTHGALLPYAEGSYSPSAIEYGVIIGLLALGALLLLLFMKVFPIVELEERPAPAAGMTKPSLGGRRLYWAIALVVAGFALQALSYFYLAAPLGIPTNPTFSEPRVPFAPLIFIAGVMMVFVAALVYELLPERPKEVM